MSCILFVSGNALGHITRLLSVASELEKIDDSKVTFLTPSNFNYGDLVTSAGYELHFCQTNIQKHNNIGMDFDTFSEGVAKLVAKLNPKAIVVDCAIYRFLPAMRWPKVPRILITNVFLTQASDYDTIQYHSFNATKDIINTRRQSLGLGPIEAATDLYDADLVCLADPLELVEQFDDLPRNFKACGATYWENRKLPTDNLPEIESAVLFSMGSTGRAKIDSNFVEHLKKATGATSAIYAGKGAGNFAGSGIMDYATNMMPIQHYFPKTKLVVTQGGAGSTYQALSYGMPVAILPSHRNHEILGEVLEKLGLAARIHTLEGLQAFLPDTHKRIEKNARLFAEKAKNQNGPKEIAKQIASFLKQQPSGVQTKLRNANSIPIANVSRKFRYANSTAGPLAKNSQHNFALRQTMMAFVSNACCTWIPKNGCSTVRFSIAKANGCVRDLTDINWIHSNNQTFAANTESAFRASYTFAILRCPFSRLYSAFMDKIVNFDIQAWKFHTARGRTTHPHDITFKKFVSELKEMNPPSFDIHWQRQVDFLLFKGYDELFSFEDFPTFSKTVKRKIGLDIVDTRPSVGHETSSQSTDTSLESPYNNSALDLLNLGKRGQRPDPKAMFDPEIASVVKGIYKRDLVLYERQFGKSELMDYLE